MVARNTIVLGVARAIDRGTTFILTLVLASKLGAAAVGTYATALAFYGIFVTAGDAGATLFLIRELAKDKLRTSTYVPHLSAMALGVCAVLTIAGEIVVRHVGYAPEVQESVAVVLLALFPKTLNSIQEAVFVVYGRTELETITTLISSVAIVSISLWLLENGHGVLSVVTVLVAVEYAVTVVYYVLITRLISRLRWRFSSSLARRIVVDIKPFAGSSLLGALFARPEIILLSLMSTPQEVGYYSAAVRISEIFLFIPVVFMNNVYPLLTRAFQAGQERFREVQFKAIVYTMAYCLPITAGTCVLAGPIIHAFFGSKFEPSVVELQLLSFNLLLYTLMGMLWRSVSARNRQDVVLRVQLIITAVRLISGVALIVPLASLGAAISATASSGLHVMLLEAAQRRGGAPARIIKASWRLAIAAGAMAALSWLLIQWVTIWVVVPVAAVAYAAGVLALRAVPAEDLRELREMISSWTTRGSGKAAAST